jgi:hypothetical protein
MRESIYSALFDLILASPAVAGKFVTTSRFLRHHAQVAREQMPALFMCQTGEDWTRPGRGIPAKRTLQCGVVMYAWSSSVEDTLPATLCNALMDAIDTALNTPNNPENVVTLNGQVYHVYIEGAVKVSEGLLQEISIVDVPIRILIP